MILGKLSYKEHTIIIIINFCAKVRGLKNKMNHCHKSLHENFSSKLISVFENSYDIAKHNIVMDILL